MNKEIERLCRRIKLLESLTEEFKGEHRKIMMPVEALLENVKSQLEREEINERSLDDLFKETMNEVNQIFEGD